MKSIITAPKRLSSPVVGKAPRPILRPRLNTVARPVLKRLVAGLLLAVTVSWALPASDAQELRSAYFALAAIERGEAGPDSEQVADRDPGEAGAAGAAGEAGDAEQVADLTETIRRSGSTSAEGEVRSGARFDSSTALREAARIALPQINAASGANPSRLSEETAKALRVLIDPAVARRVLHSSDIDPLLELSFERLAVLYEQQSHLQRLGFARQIDLSLDRYRGVSAITKVYAARSAAQREPVQTPDSNDGAMNGYDQQEFAELLAELAPIEAAVLVLARPELRRYLAMADPDTPGIQAFTAGLEELYQQVDRAVAESDLSAAGYSMPRVELLRPTLGAGRLSESVVPYRRNVALSAIPSGDGAQRRILPYEIAAELYYGVFYDLSYEHRAELDLGAELDQHAELQLPQSQSELWGRLHAQYVVAVPGGDSASQSLEERFVAELETEFSLYNALDGTPSAEAFARELNDSILRSASRNIERPLLRLNMQPELYLGVAYRQLHPSRPPEENFAVLRRVLTELEHDVLAERRYLRSAAEQMRGDGPPDTTAGTRP